MSRQIEAEIVVFDFDGTIVDSMPFLIQVATHLLATRHDMDPSQARRAYVDTCGLPFAQQIEIILPGDVRNQATVEEFERRKREQLMEFDLFTDVSATIGALRDHGLKVAVSSGNIEELILELLATRELPVDLVMGYRPGFEKGIAHFEHACRTFDSSADKLVFIGDSERDGLKAREAGVCFIAKAGLLTADEIRRALPGTPVVEELVEVLPLLGIQKAQEGFGVSASSQAS